jgi:hypothetical protein
MCSSGSRCVSPTQAHGVLCSDWARPPDGSGRPWRPPLSTLHPARVSPAFSSGPRVLHGTCDH